MFGRGKWWEWESARPRSIYGPFTVFHAQQGGAPVLRGESSWRTVNGLMVQHPRLGRFVFIFRRHGKWGI
jgi:hypothetical protein